MQHLGTGTLTTDRLILRRFSPDDAPTMFSNWASDDEVTRTLSWPTHASVEVTVSVLRDWEKAYENLNFYIWAITLRDGGEVVGSIGLHNANDHDERAVAGYCIGRAWWGQGIVTEALRAVLDFAFLQVGLNRVSAYHYADNPASGRVMEKAGMRYEGFLRGYARTGRGELVDCRQYAALRRDWEKPPAGTAAERARALYEQGYNCAQSVLGALCGGAGLSESAAAQIACGFGGGLRSGEVCGAISGAVMALGLRMGAASPDDKQAKARCETKTREIVNAVKEKYGTVSCRELLVRNPGSTPGGRRCVCVSLVEQAAAMLDTE